MGKVRNEVGNKYGRLIVLERAGQEVTKGGVFRTEARWLCKCDCGNMAIVRGESLRKGVTASCGCYTRLIDLSGKTFGKWVVLRRAENKGYGDAAFLCVCACGVEKIVDANSLRRGDSNSCRCSFKLPRGEAAFRQLYSQNKYNAKYREIEWILDLEFFRWITKQPCHYCGIEPYQVHEQKRANGSYVFNGIDRVNNEVGYIPENCVPCCGHCNYIKSAQDINDFKSWIVSVYNHWAKSESRQ